MIARAQIVGAARSYIGTPYLHQGRVKGHGVDCVGQGVCIMRDLGIKPADWNVTGYRRLPDGYSLMHHLRENMGAAVDQADMQPGDLVVVAFDRWPHHVGVLGDHPGGGFSLIHANSKAGRVEEVRLVFDQGMRFVAAFQFPGVV